MLSSPNSSLKPSLNPPTLSHPLISLVILSLTFLKRTFHNLKLEIYVYGLLEIVQLYMCGYGDLINTRLADLNVITMRTEPVSVLYVCDQHLHSAWLTE